MEQREQASRLLGKSASEVDKKKQAITGLYEQEVYFGEAEAWLNQWNFTGSETVTRRRLDATSDDSTGKDARWTQASIHCDVARGFHAGGCQAEPGASGAACGSGCVCHTIDEDF